MAINERYNYDDVFLRDLTISVLAELENKIRWTNVFESGLKDVDCKIYYSLTGSEDYLMDSFNDDIASDQRFVELNTDSYPRGHLTLSSWNIRSDEFANPNVWLRMVVENQEEMKSLLTKVRAMPITANYQLSVLVNSEIDTFKASQSIMNTMWAFRYFYFEYNFMNIDAVLEVPEDQDVEIQREHNLSTPSEIKLTLNFQVKTYYPSFSANASDLGISLREDLKIEDINSSQGVTWNSQLMRLSNGTSTTKFDFKVEQNISRTDNALPVTVIIKSSGKISFKIFGTMANLLEHMEVPDRLGMGSYDFNIDISDKQKFPTGIYYLKIEVDDEQVTIKIRID